MPHGIEVRERRQVHGAILSFCRHKSYRTRDDWMRRLVPPPPCVTVEVHEKGRTGIDVKQDKVTRPDRHYTADRRNNGQVLMPTNDWSNIKCTDQTYSRHYALTALRRLPVENCSW